MIDRILRFLRLSPNPFLSDEPKRYYDLITSVFEISKQDHFMGDNNFPVHFTNTQRSFAVHEILQTTPYGRIQKGEVGIDRLINERVFQAAYSLHEGDYKFEKTEKRSPFQENNPRRVLYDTWARYRLFYKYQPLDLIRDYFGEKVGLYFAWLGKIKCILFLSFIILKLEKFIRTLYNLASTGITCWFTCFWLWVHPAI